MSLNKIKITKNIDSILQVTNDVIYKSNNYREYILNQNNSLYMRQLPLLMKHERMKALISKKIEDTQKNSSSLIFQEEDKAKEIKEKSKLNLYKHLSPLSNIRNIKIKSKKLPPLCPLYNSQGELIPAAIKSSKIIYKKIDYNDFLNKINMALGFEKKGIPKRRKLEIKKLKYNKSCDFDLKIKLDDLEKNYFSTPEYEYLKYDENLIFGKDSIKNYEEIIKNKIIELQTVYNQNDTIIKEKEYIYGFDRRKILLTLESLKIKIFEIKNEDAPIIEIKDDKPCFEYILPFALLPLFYFKGVDSFLMILTKIINFKEINLKFELKEKYDEIIASILRNCSDFDIHNNDEYNTNERDLYANDNNDINNNELQSSINHNNSFKRQNSNKNVLLNNETKNNNILNSFFNALNSSQNNINEQNTSNIPEENNTSNSNKYSNKNNNNTNLDSNISNDLRKTTLSNIKKNASIQTFEIYASKRNKDEKKIISQYEFFWITPTKSFILYIETPLITIFAPSNNNYIKEYINFELLFYIYQNSFIMWDFYIMKYLSQIKNFRIFFEQLYSIQKKMNISLFLTKPKSKKLLSTNFDLASIITRPESDKYNKNINSIESPKLSKRYESSKTKVYTSSNLASFKKNNNINTNTSKSRYSKQIENKINNSSNTNLASSYSPSKIRHNETDKDMRLKMCNSIFTQKGLLFIITFINEENETIREFVVHFNVDQLRKFQIMEIMQDKMSYFLKFLHIHHDSETISFDFESFKEFNELKWIKQINKYNFNSYLSQCQTISEKKFVDENGQELKVIKVLKSHSPNVQIKVEMKCPLILIQDLDDLGFKTTERVNVDSNVESILSKLTIHNTLDLTKQLVDILKNNNFCRKIISSNRIFKKKTTKNKINVIKDSTIIKKKSKTMLGVITDLKEY